jgi:hypothetical protein
VEALKKLNGGMLMSAHFLLREEIDPEFTNSHIWRGYCYDKDSFPQSLCYEEPTYSKARVYMQDHHMADPADVLGIQPLMFQPIEFDDLKTAVWLNIVGTYAGKRAVEVAVAGKLSLLLVPTELHTYAWLLAQYAHLYELPAVVISQKFARKDFWKNQEAFHLMVEVGGLSPQNTAENRFTAAMREFRLKDHQDMLKRIDGMLTASYRGGDLDLDAGKFLQLSKERFDLSETVVKQVCQIGRVIANLAQSQKILSEHILEAVHFKRLTDFPVGDYAAWKHQHIASDC